MLSYDRREGRGRLRPGSLKDDFYVVLCRRCAYRTFYFELWSVEGGILSVRPRIFLDKKYSPAVLRSLAAVEVVLE